MSANNLASPEALKAVNKSMFEKIVVSDDDDSDDDSDSEDDDDSEDEAEPCEELKIIQLTESDGGSLDNIAFGFDILPTLVQLDTFSSPSTSSISEIFDEPVKEEEASEDNKMEANYEQMKVDELRKIVSDRNLATKEDVKKLKKPELLVLLKKV